MVLSYKERTALKYIATQTVEELFVIKGRSSIYRVPYKTLKTLANRLFFDPHSIYQDLITDYIGNFYNFVNYFQDVHRFVNQEKYIKANENLLGFNKNFNVLISPLFSVLRNNLTIDDTYTLLLFVFSKGKKHERSKDYIIQWLYNILSKQYKYANKIQNS